MVSDLRCIFFTSQTKPQERRVDSLDNMKIETENLAKSLGLEMKCNLITKL